MTKMICIIGLSGTGKSTYLNEILAKRVELKISNLKRLVYYTTRKPRPGEINGLDYYFVNFEEKPVSLVALKGSSSGVMISRNPELVEERCYKTENNGVVYYYTTKNCVEDKYYICAPSIEQLNSYADYFGDNRIAIVELDVDLKTRIKRMIDQRSTTDNDIYEICRRVLAEREEWKDGYKQLFAKHKGIKYMRIDNSKDGQEKANIKAIAEFIREQLER